jgi:hypothetical protein
MMPGELEKPPPSAARRESVGALPQAADEKRKQATHTGRPSRPSSRTVKAARDWLAPRGPR